MKRRVFIIFILTIVLSLILFGCSSNEETETTPPIQENSENVEPEKIEESDEVIVVTELDNNNEEKVIASENDVELFNTLVGGFFYSKNEDMEYELARKGAIDFYNEQVLVVLEDCIEVKENLEQYEKELLNFIDEISDPQTEYNEDFQYIIDTMMSYKTGINTYSLQARGYNEKIKNYKNSDVNRAFVDGEIFNLTIKLHNLLDEYISFLVYTSEYLAISMTDEISEEFGNRIREGMNTSFNENVIDSLANLTLSYGKLANTYAYIASVDYYESLSIKDETLKLFKSMEETENIKTLIESLDREKPEPKYLIELIETETIEENEEVTFKLPILIVAHAENTVEDDLNTISYRASLKGMLNQIKRIEEKNGEVTDEEMSVIIFEMLVRGKKLKEQLTSKIIEESVPTRKQLFQIMVNVPSNKFVSIKEEVEDENNKNQPEVNSALEAMSNNIEAMNEEIISMEKRKEFIEMLIEFQKTDDAKKAYAALYVPEIFGGGTDVVYEKIINKFGLMLSKNKDKFNSEVYENLEGLLFNDLSEILGDKKFDFINKFLNGSAEEIVNSFSDWVNNSNNRGDIDINRNSLFELLEALGIKLESEDISEEAPQEDVREEEPVNEEKEEENEWDHSKEDTNDWLGNYGFSGEDSDFEVGYDKEKEKINDAGIKSITRFNDNKPVQSIVYDKNGKLTLQSETHTSGMKTKRTYRDGLKNTESYYGAEGNQLYQKKYHNDGVNVVNEMFFENGELTKSVNYRIDGTINNMSLYHEGGKIRSAEHSFNENGEIMQSLEFDKEGKKIDSKKY